MKAKLTLENVPAIKATMVITMTIEQWTRITDAVNSERHAGYTGQDFRNTVNGLIEKAVADHTATHACDV